jgi:hypothetical protein
MIARSLFGKMRAWQNFIILACAFSKLLEVKQIFKEVGRFFSSLFIALLSTFLMSNSNFDLLRILA